MEVYVLSYEDCNNNHYTSNIIGVYNSIELARKVLKEIKNEDLQNLFDNGYGNYKSIDELCKSIVKETEDKLVFEFYDDYTIYTIERYEVKE